MLMMFTASLGQSRSLLILAACILQIRSLLTHRIHGTGETAADQRSRQGDVHGPVSDERHRVSPSSYSRHGAEAVHAGQGGVHENASLAQHQDSLLTHRVHGNRKITADRQSAQGGVHGNASGAQHRVRHQGLGPGIPVAPAAPLGFSGAPPPFPPQFAAAAPPPLYAVAPQPPAAAAPVYAVAPQAPAGAWSAPVYYYADGSPGAPPPPPDDSAIPGPPPLPPQQPVYASPAWAPGQAPPAQAFPPPPDGFVYAQPAAGRQFANGPRHLIPRRRQLVHGSVAASNVINEQKSRLKPLDGATAKNANEIAGNLGKDASFTDAMKSLGEHLRSTWVACQNELHEYWLAYNSADFQPRRFVVFTSGGEEYLGLLLNQLPNGNFMVAYVDEDNQAISGTEMEIPQGELKASDSLVELITAMIHHECVARTSGIITEWMKFMKDSVGAYFKHLFNKFAQSGVIKMHVSAGVSHVPLYGALWLMHHSLRAEYSLSVAIWPQEVQGTVAAANCAGKDTNHLSADLSIGLAIAFDRSCFAGQGIEFEGALQLPHNQELTLSVAFAQDESGTVEMTRINNMPFPVIDEISINYGVAAKGNIASPWNPSSHFAFAGVQCIDYELKVVGPRAADC